MFRPADLTVRYRGQLAVETKKGLWSDGVGKLLVTEDKGEEVTNKQKHRIKRIIVLDAGLDHQLVSLLVACWTVKV